MNAAPAKQLTEAKIEDILKKVPLDLWLYGELHLWSTILLV